MIFVRDKGQMCNNIIQFGHAYGWARENGHRAISMRFGYKYRYFNICRTPGHNFATYFFAKIMAALRVFPDIVYKYRDVDHSREEARAARCHWWPTVVSRWNVRHYDDFERHLGEIRQLFGLLPRYQAVVDERWREVVTAGSRVIGLHVRRGDYSTFYDGHFMLSDDDYIAAARATIALHPDEPHTVIVCGNDPKLDAERYKRDISDGMGNIRVYVSKGAEWEDLGLFSKCDYLIGPPSSYTLVASMYGKARLRWLLRGEKVKSLDEFVPFEVSFRKFDDYFRNL